MKGSIYAAQIRMSEEMHQRVMRIASDTGDTMNGTMLHLMYLGLKLLEAGQFSVSSPDDSGK